MKSSAQERSFAVDVAEKDGTKSNVDYTIEQRDREIN